MVGKIINIPKNCRSITQQVSLTSQQAICRFSSFLIDLSIKEYYLPNIFKFSLKKKTRPGPGSRQYPLNII